MGGEATCMGGSHPMRGLAHPSIQYAPHQEITCSPPLGVFRGCQAPNRHRPPSPVIGCFPPHRRVRSQSAYSLLCHPGMQSCVLMCAHVLTYVHPTQVHTLTYYLAQHRYLVCNKYFVPGGPIFFYAGNEADVMLYAGLGVWDVGFIEAPLLLLCT